MTDKSWMWLRDRSSSAYEFGVRNFIWLAAHNRNPDGLSWCPCSLCRNVYSLSLREVEQHLYSNGMDLSYTHWRLHGEIDPTQVASSSNIVDVQPSPPYGHYDPNTVPAEGYNNAWNVPGYDDEDDDDEFPGADNRAPDDTINPTNPADKFEEIIRRVQTELYPGCSEVTLQSAVLTLMQVGCVRHGFPDEII